MADVQVLTDDNFHREIASGFTLVDFWAEWCPPCKRVVGPMMAELADAYGAALKVAKLNVDDNPRVAMQFRVMSLPTVMLFHQGQPLEAMIGAQPRRAYDATLGRHLSRAA